MKHLVVLTGAGISAESGIPTFRDSGGLWEGYDFRKVATPEAWAKDPDMVLDFYNLRRKNIHDARPNQGHHILADLESHFKVSIVTQNIDDLHERAGSTSVLHLHGKIFESRSTADPSQIYPIKGWKLNPGDTCDRGSQLRPNIVWFGEMVPAMVEAADIAASADILLIVGTSMTVYPAAGLLIHTNPVIPKFVVDPNLGKISGLLNLTQYNEVASSGLRKVQKDLLELQ